LPILKLSDVQPFRQSLSEWTTGGTSPILASHYRNKSPQAFEGLRHYGPEKVVDALAAILNQITGQDFGFIYNGTTDAERDKTVRGWRDFLHKTPPTKLCDGG
jgi:hypothetical protein